MLGDIASLATAVGLFIAIWQLRQQQALARSQFEEGMVARYWNILDRLSVEARLGHVAALTEEDRRAAHSYFKLSDEEIYLARARKKIRKETWATWRGGIIETMKREPFLSEWARVRQDPTAVTEYKDLFELLESNQT